MELTTKQLEEVDRYISCCGIKYYDVRAEIVDHFASVLEKRLEENPDLDFKQEVVKIHKNFSNKGFHKLLKDKTESVHKKFYVSSLKHLLSFFKPPKIIISIAIFFGLNEILKITKDKNNFFFILSVIGILIMFQMLIRVSIKRKKKTVSFLVLNKSDSFMQLINFLFIMYNSSINFRPQSSFENELYNQIHLGVYVLFILFYFSGEYVFRQNKKMVLEQYPKVIV
jgi:hypothetical protein